MKADQLEKHRSLMQGLKFGVEVETVGIGRQRAAQAVASVVGGTVQPASITGHGDYQVVAADGRTWNVVYDGSLGYDGAEVTTPILSWADVETLQKVVRAVRAAGGRADDRCGIHVHVDGREMGAKDVRALVSLVHNREQLIEWALGIAHHRRERYCRPVDPAFVRRVRRQARDFGAIQAAWYGVRDARSAHVDRYSSTRYSGLNLNSLYYRGTVEFRWFNGTLHAGKVKAYVMLCLGLMTRARTATVSGERREWKRELAHRDFSWVLQTQLGLVGDEFKNVRTHLLAKLAPQTRAAERRERADEQAEQAAAAEAASVLAQAEALRAEESVVRAGDVRVGTHPFDAREFVVDRVVGGVAFYHYMNDFPHEPDRERPVFQVQECSTLVRRAAVEPAVGGLVQPPLSVRQDDLAVGQCRVVTGPGEDHGTGMMGVDTRVVIVAVTPAVVTYRYDRSYIGGEYTRPRDEFVANTRLAPQEAAHAA